MHEGKLISLMLIGLIGLFAVSSLVGDSHAQISGSVCIVDPVATNCPSSPAVFTGGVGTILAAAVRVQSSDSFNSFDIAVKADPSVLSPLRVDLSNITFASDSFMVNVRCVNGRGINCGMIDGPGVVHLYVVTSSTPTPASGPLFTISYRILAASTGTPIDFQGGCPIESSFDACVNLADGLTTFSETLHPAAFTSFPLAPNFVVSWHPVFVPLTRGAIEMGPGSIVLLRLDFAPFNGFIGAIDVSASSSPSGLDASVDQSSLFLISPTVIADVVVVSNPVAAIPGRYTINVTAAGGSTTHSILIPIQVIDSDFTVLVEPRSATIDAGESFFPAILLTGLNFSGNVSVTVAVLPSVAKGLSVQTAFPSFSVSNGFITSGPIAIVQSSSTTPTGTYRLNAVLRSGSLVHSSTIIIAVIGVSTN
jgi:hypothetical protein